MILYLSAAFHRRAEIRAVADTIHLLQNDANPRVRVQARWLYGLDQVEAFGNAREAAYLDKADVFACDVFVRFSDNLSTPTIPSGWGSGSRMEETGMACAWGKTIVIVGGRQSVFDHLPERIQLVNTNELYECFGLPKGEY